MNVWTVCWDQKSGRCREVAVSGGSTVILILWPLPLIQIPV